MLQDFVHIITHLDQYLNQWVQAYGQLVYLFLFLIIFCETGLIVTPLLPGDSLLFAVGALCASSEVLNIPTMMLVLITASILGDLTNYTIGRWLRGHASRWQKFVNQKHFDKAEAFYQKYGGKTVFMAKFLPIFRTYAPFVAGVSHMDKRKFILFNVAGGATWVSLFLIAGHQFAGLEIVKERFHLVILAIMVVSLLPILFEILKHKFGKSSDKQSV